jgi:hypothetical protein
MKFKNWTYVKMAGKIFGLFILGLVALGFLIGLFYGDDIKKMIITELNKNLAAEIQVEKFEFSVFRHFPYASVEMQKVLAKGVLKSLPDDTLLYAGHISLLFNMSGVFSGNVAVKKIVAQNGVANIRIDKQGNNNYRFWKVSGDSLKNASVIDLQKIALKEIVIRYEDLKNDQHYLMRTDEAELSGKFSEDQYILSADASLFMEHFYAGKINYINQKPLVLRTGLQVNNLDGTYKFGHSSVKIADLSFDIGGFVVDQETTTLLALEINTREARLEELISLLPPEYIKYFKKYRSKGFFESALKIEGKAGSGNLPVLNAAFKIRDGKLTPDGSSVSLTDIDLQGSFTSKGISGKSELDIPDMSAILGDNKLNAGIMIHDLQDPFLDLRARAVLDLARVRHFISLDTLVSLQGKLKINIAFAGKVKDVNKYSLAKQYSVQSSGMIELEKVSFVLKHNPLEYKNFQGRLVLQDNDLKVEDLSGNVSSSDLKLNGTFKNFVGFIFIPDQSAEFNAKLSSNTLNLDELLVDKSSTDDTSYIMKFNPRLYSNLEVNIGNITFRRFQASRLQGSILLNRQVISGKELTFSAMHGMIYMDANINASRKDSILMNFDARISSIDVTELFWQLENFGQTTMTDKNVKGKINAEVQLRSSWTTSLKINPAKVRAICDISIENGELIRFIPIQAMAKYIKVPDLNNIRFSTLRNQISISDRRIYIPSMEIKSSALNLTATGVHDFDNVVDYRLRLLLSDVLGKKVKQNSEFGEIEDDGLGRTQLLLTMKGPVTDPRFGYDRKGAAEKIKTDMAKEKQTMKSILKEEFGMFRKDTLKTEKKPKKQEMEIDWESEEE